MRRIGIAVALGLGGTLAQATPALDAVAATAWAASPSQLALATATEVHLYDVASGKSLQSWSRLPGEVVSLAVREGQAAWIVRSGGRELLQTATPGAQPTQWALPTGSPLRLLFLGETLTLVAPRTLRTVNPLTGDLSEDTSQLPSSVVAASLTSDLYAGPNGLTLAVRPYKVKRDELGSVVMSLVQAFRGSELLGSYSTVAPRYTRLNVRSTDNQDRIAQADFLLGSPGFVWAPKGIVLLEPRERVEVPFLEPNWNPNRREGFAPEGRPLAAEGDGIWSLSGPGLWYSRPEEVQSFAPWNGAGDVLGVAPRPNGPSWIITRNGTRPLDPKKPDTKFGFGGFLRVSHAPPKKWTEKQRKLVQELESWIGTPYKWGGNDRTGVDCSGLVVQAFKKLGISLPRTSAEMKVTKIGKVIRDELQVGDVLALPGHVAVHVGGGETIEAVDGGVGRSSIWRRSQVVVRRFLP